MSKFVLTASKSTPKEGMLKFHATLSCEEFIANGYADKHGIDIIVNPNGNKHPKGYFMSWKDNEGVSYSGAVSNNITSPEEFTDPVISIVSTPDNKDMFVLMHNRHEAPADNQVLNFR